MNYIRIPHDSSVFAFEFTKLDGKIGNQNQLHILFLYVISAGGDSLFEQLIGC